MIQPSNPVPLHLHHKQSLSLLHYPQHYCPLVSVTTTLTTNYSLAFPPSHRRADGIKIPTPSLTNLTFPAQDLSSFTSYKFASIHTPSSINPTRPFISITLRHVDIWHLTWTTLTKSNPVTALVTQPQDDYHGAYISALGAPYSRRSLVLGFLVISCISSRQMVYNVAVSGLASLPKQFLQAFAPQKANTTPYRLSYCLTSFQIRRCY